MRGERRAVGGSDPLDRVVRRSRFAMASSRSPAPSGRSAPASRCSGPRSPSASPRSRPAASSSPSSAVAGASLPRPARARPAPLPLAARRARPGPASTRSCPAGRSPRCATGRRSAATTRAPGGLGRAPRADAPARRQRAPRGRRPAARRARPLGAAADGAGRARSPRWSSPATAASSRLAAALQAGPAPPPSPPARASRAGPSRRPTPAGRRSTCPRCRGDAPVAVPQGTVVTLRVYGDAEGLRARRDRVAAARRPPLPRRRPASPRRAFAVAASGAVTLGAGRPRPRRLDASRWSPTPPRRSRSSASLERTATGETRLAYEAKDDHGVAAARAEIALDPAGVDRRFGLAAEPEAPPTLVVDLPMPMTGDADALAETLVEDFSKHPLRRPAGDRAPDRRGRDRPDRRQRDGRGGAADAALLRSRGRRRWSSSAATCSGRRRTPGASPRCCARSPTGPRACSTARAPISWSAPRSAGSTPPRRPAPSPGSATRSPRRCGRRRCRSRTATSATPPSGWPAPRSGCRRRSASDATDEEIAQLMDELRQATRDYMEQMAREAIENGEMQQAEIAAPARP